MVPPSINRVTDECRTNGGTSPHDVYRRQSDQVPWSVIPTTRRRHARARTPRGRDAARGREEATGFADLRGSAYRGVSTACLPAAVGRILWAWLHRSTTSSTSGATGGVVLTPCPPLPSGEGEREPVHRPPSPHGGEGDRG